MPVFSKTRTSLVPGWVLMMAAIFPAALYAAEEWKEEKGEHFIVYYNEAASTEDETRDSPRSFAREVLREAEKCYDRTARELGYQRNSKFWTWDNRAKIYVYHDHQSYLSGTGHPVYTKGYANYEEKTLVGCRDNDKEFLKAILPHEIGHLMFRDFIGFENDVPLWLDEGVAQWQEREKRQIAKRTAREMLKNGGMISLASLVAIRDTTELQQKVTTVAGISGFYVQSVSLVDFLVSKYGKDRFTAFCRNLRDGKTLEESLKLSYPAMMGGLAELEEKWLRYIKEED